MAYLVKEDLYAKIYQEIIEEIVRDNATVIPKAISSAIAETKSYLSRFDLVAMFGNDTVEATVQDDYLKDIVSDIACWNIIKLANPNINMELFRTSYEDAIKFLEKVMKGQASPDGWIYKSDNSGTTINENSTVQWSSNKKRRHDF